jgi:O-succinylbenzoic acid--CoA ligase
MPDQRPPYTSFLTSEFWLAPDIYLALSPYQPVPPDHLIATAKPHLPEGGCLFMTSGTTGAPKWVALEKRALLHSARVVNAHYNLTASDHWLLTLPLHHVGGFSILARAYLTGSPVSQAPLKWHVTAFHDALVTTQATATSLVPTQVHDLVAAQMTPPPCLRLVLVGGGRINPELLRQALELGWPVCATYGMTEAASQIASQPLEHDRMADPETLEVLPHWHVKTDSENTLIIQGPALAKGFLSIHEHGTNWEPIAPDSGLTTRDQIHLRLDGTRTFLTFLSRHDNVIKVNGELVSLESLEQQFGRLLPADAPPLAMVALPDPRRENRLFLAIESPDKTPPADMVTALATFNANCAPYERIDDLYSLAELPRTELGKLARATLTTVISQRTGSVAIS